MGFSKITIYTQNCNINQFGQLRLKKSFLFLFATRFYKFIYQNK